MSEEIIKNIPAEVKLAYTANTLTASITLLNKVLAPLVGIKKYNEINNKIWGEGAAILFPMIKKDFKIPGDDAIAAANIIDVVSLITISPEFESERVEESPTRVVQRTSKCPWMDRAKEYGLEAEFASCPEGHQAWGVEGCKAINPKLTHTIKTFMPRGDPYCEYVIEFKK